MEFKGTKGNWIYNNSLQMNSGYRVIYSVNGVLIHKSENINGLSELEIEANAQLITNSPKLLEALQRVEDYLTALYESNETAPFPLRSELDNVREVINQATKID
jgi:hypothetical protein